LIITISGLHGTGKSTIGQKIAEIFNLRYYATGEAFRKLAKEYKMSLADFTDYAEKHPDVDIELDKTINTIADEGNVLIDSQLSAYILKEKADFKILLTCHLETRVKRMCERDKTSYKEKVDETLRRELSEAERFKRLYNINLKDEDKKKEIYDLIVDTKNLTVDEVISRIESEIKKKKI
jgi:cytidylate kinase